MTPKRALVTGISGFVGPHLAKLLVERSCEVHALGPEPTAPANLAVASWHTADVRDATALVVAVAAVRPDAVVHLAGQSSAARSFEIPEETFTVNTLGTWNLLEAVRSGAPHARVLIVGTSEVYGPQPEGTRVAEIAPFRPVSPYALSKAAADALAELFGRQQGLDVIRTRSFGHTGPGQTPRFVIPAWAEQIAAVEAGRAEPVLRVGNLEVTRDLLDVRDVVRAYVALLEHGQGGEAYNVCRGEGARLSEIAASLVARARVPIRIEPDPARMRAADVPYLVGDPGKLERDTGWRAGIPLEQTLDRVLSDWLALTPR
jgi:GDP-4-dehydro-6-deoxy-D-mannose reductase